MAGSKITKAALASTLKELMLKDPFSKISIGEICEACGMNRKSFYYHFRDKYDLVNWIFQTGFVESLNFGEYDTGWEFVSDILNYLYGEHAFYRHALSIEGQNSFTEYFAETLAPFISAFSGGIYQKTNNPDFYIDITCKVFICVIKEWLDHKNPVPPDEFAKTLNAIFTDLLESQNKYLS